MWPTGCGYESSTNPRALWAREKIWKKPAFTRDPREWINAAARFCRRWEGLTPEGVSYRKRRCRLVGRPGLRTAGVALVAGEIMR